MGRKTYNFALDYQKKTGGKGAIFDSKLANSVFSHNSPRNLLPGVTFVTEPVKAFARRLRAKLGKHIWMMGGAELIASFLDAGEIDQFDIHVMPLFIGEGIPLIAPHHREISLNLRSARKYPDGVVRQRYELERHIREQFMSSAACAIQ